MTLLDTFTACRAHTMALTAPLSIEDHMLQSMPDASPAKWHLGHTTWFFETFILEALEPGFEAFEPAFRVLFNSYYNGIGEQHPRPQRGLLSRPGLDTVHAWREQVEQRVLKLLQAADEQTLAELAPLLVLGINHEQQHQELIVTDLKHGLWHNPAWPAYLACEPEAFDGGTLQWLPVAGGEYRVGYQGEAGGFSFDNEHPAHSLRLAPFEMASRQVTNGDWLAFMEDGGYQDPLLWLSEGWAWLQENTVNCPLYWRQRDGQWQQFMLHGAADVNGQLPVSHISFFEADAFARWAGARLPTEFEWEVSAGMEAPVGARHVRDVTKKEHHQTWQWTNSAYLPYPGFAPPPGAVGEYNGKFMINQMVLRGASSATPPGHARPSYRNFFPTHARWQYTGLRLARDL
jgi:ergothioneine biosynthesis protein EgtB